jgi:hypothetical protein
MAAEEPLLPLLTLTLVLSMVASGPPPDPHTLTRDEVDEQACTASCLTLGVCVGLTVCTGVAATGPANAVANQVLQIGEPVQPGVTALAIAAAVPLIGGVVGLVDATVAHQQGPDVVPWLPPVLAGAAAAVGVAVVGVPLVAASFFAGYAVVLALPAAVLAVTGVGAWLIVSAPSWARHAVARPRGAREREAPPLWEVPPPVRPTPPVPPSSEESPTAPATPAPASPPLEDPAADEPDAASMGATP